MQNGMIPDSAIKASSSYDNASVGPSNGRIRTELHGGAWCPRNQIQRNVYEWLEIDFQELKVVTQVETQGRFGHGQGQEFTDSYMLEYKRLDGGPWIRFKDRKGNSVSGQSLRFI
jgi:discoidin domain receptor family protein 2